jgi:four helix bundle protein
MSNIETISNIKSKNAFEKAHSDQSRPYDLEERTFQFAKESRAFVRTLPRTIANVEDVKQFIRASGSIGANYIEANESIGKKDFLMKIKTCRREAKESGYWLRLLDIGGNAESGRQTLLSEAVELMKIFGAIVRKSEE